jgi:CDP-glucose 4,6-dehydratase
VEDLELKPSTPWSNRRVLVTGGTGLVGSWLVRALVDSGAYTVVLIRDYDRQSELIRSGTVARTSVISGALEDYSTVERAINEHETDIVFHLGAQAIVGAAYRSPLATFESNIRGSYNVLEACRRRADIVRAVVIASSDKAYGESPNLPYTEDMPPLGRGPYDVSKSCTDLLSQSYAYSYGLPVTIARCGNIYGGGDLNWSRIVPGTIRSLLHGERPVIRSDGEFVRDYVYVEDVVQAYLKLGADSHRPEFRGEAFNFGPERPVSVLELVSRIRDLMSSGHLEPVILNQARAEIRDQYLSYAKAADQLGWQPRYSLEDGLRRTVQWYSQYFGHSAAVQA